jgi:hypothetical protein
MVRRALDLSQETGDLLFAAFSQAHLISLASHQELGWTIWRRKLNAISSPRTGRALV